MERERERETDRQTDRQRGADLIDEIKEPWKAKSYADDR
jgi:hypothetical protein